MKCWPPLKPNLFQSVQPFDHISQAFELLTPYNPPKCRRGVSWGELFLARFCPFPDESTDVYRIWCQSIQPFDSFNRLLNLWPPKTPKMPPSILRCELYLAYVHSQANPQTWTKSGANQSSCLRASPDCWICDPLKPPGVLRGDLYLAHVHSRRIRRFVPNLVPIGPAIWQLRQTFEFVTP